MKSQLCVLFFICCIAYLYADSPCASRAIDGESVVCVCNSTYCDDITKVTPTSGSYVGYTSSKAGLRFSKFNGSLQSYSESDDYDVEIEVSPSTTYQTIYGFGGAVTDSAGINWKTLSDEVQQKLINSYFGQNGLEYNMIRVPIGGSDFSTYSYAYNETPEDDADLTNYTLTAEDYNYKIPMIKAAIEAATDTVNIVATTWSPPTWMKTNDDYTGFSRVQEEYFQTYADYHLKFLELYDKQDIPIWGITTTNEPLNGVIPLVDFNSLGWSPSSMASWVVENLGPTIRNSTFNNTKIILADDQRYTLPFWVNLGVLLKPELLDWIDGVGVHYYGNIITPAAVLDLVTENFPNKFVISTEACEGSYPLQEDVLLGSWDRAQSYISTIIEDLSHSLVGWIDWNLCLDSTGGPNWAENYVDSPIITYGDSDEFVKQPMFYAMGHFSKFVPRNSIMVESETDAGLLGSLYIDVETISFVTPNNTVVIVVHNEDDDEREVRIKVEDQQIVLTLEASSVTTLELSL